MKKEMENTGGKLALPERREISFERWEEENVQQYELLMEFYEAAMEKTVRVLKDLSEQILAEKGSNPIRRISSRLKSSASIAEKLARKGLTYVADNIEEHVHDVAGVRVICPTPNDVYLVAARVLDRPEFTLVRKKDYILNPKKTGYRSLHLILTMDVTVNGESRRIPVEIQVRTIAMDWWASLDHDMRYKTPDLAIDSLSRELEECARLAEKLDAKMLEEEIGRSSI